MSAHIRLVNNAEAAHCAVHTDWSGYTDLWTCCEYFLRDWTVGGGLHALTHNVPSDLIPSSKPHMCSFFAFLSLNRHVGKIITKTCGRQNHPVFRPTGSQSHDGPPVHVYRCSKTTHWQWQRAWRQILFMFSHFGEIVVTNAFIWWRVMLKANNTGLSAKQL